MFPVLKVLFSLFIFIIFLTIGNTSSASWVIDLTSPTVTLTITCQDSTGKTINTITASGSNCISPSTQAVLTNIDCTDTGNPNTSACWGPMSYTVDGANFTGTGWPVNVTGSPVMKSTSGSSSHTVTVTAQDMAGNAATTTGQNNFTFTFTIPTSSPYLQTTGGDVHSNR